MKKLFISLFIISCLMLPSLAAVTGAGGGSGGVTEEVDPLSVHITGGEMTGTLTNDSIYYDNGEYPTLDSLKDAIDYLLYVAPNITSFTNTVNAVEIGSTVSSTTLNWAINKDITSQSINQGIGALAVALRTYGDSSSYTTNRTYTLNVGDGVNTDNSSTSVYFRYRKYYGATDEATVDDADILALASNPLSTSRTTTFSISPSIQYITIGYPAAWGTATFKVNGLTNTDWTLSVQSHTNASGHAASYNLYRTNNLLSGTYDIEVQ